MTDFSTELVARSAGLKKTTNKLPIGVGLTVGACASVTLWTVIGIGLRALLA